VVTGIIASFGRGIAGTDLNSRGRRVSFPFRMRIAVRRILAGAVTSQMSPWSARKLCATTPVAPPLRD